MNRYVESLNCRTTCTRSPHVEFHQNLWNCLWVTWKGHFVALSRLCCIMIQYSRKSELPENFWRKSNIHNICKTVYGTCGKLHLLAYVNLALLWISMPQNWNCLITFDGILPYRILRVSVERFMGFRFLDKLLLAFASTVIFCSRPRGTHEMFFCLTTVVYGFMGYAGKCIYSLI
jgi:hypothetical protein